MFNSIIHIWRNCNKQSIWYQGTWEQTFPYLYLGNYFSKLQVLQFDCKNEMGGPTGCLQYFTTDMGTFSSFNYGGVPEPADLSGGNFFHTQLELYFLYLKWFKHYFVLNITMKQSILSYISAHLANQNYNICIRRNNGKCSICYITSVTQIADAATIASSFGLSKYVWEYRNSSFPL